MPLTKTKNVAALLPAAIAAGIFILSPLSFAAPPSIGGCQIFPTDNIWNTPIDTLPLHASSAAWVASIGATGKLHPDWGITEVEYGIPFATVPGSQPKVPVVFDAADESDSGPYPIPANAPIEGTAASDGDRHVLVIETTNCILYEIDYAFPQNGGASWTGFSGAKFDLKSNALRPAGWTSSDAAGLPILPGLVRWEEVQAGEINHAIRFTAPRTRRGVYQWPARHWATNLVDNVNNPMMGSRFRLKASFDISGFDARTQVILRAMKKYGMILADNGSAWYFQGTTNANWPSVVLDQLKTIGGNNFEAVDVSSLIVSSNSAQVKGAPTRTPNPANAKPFLLRSGGGQMLAGSLVNNQFQFTAQNDPGASFRVVALADLNGNGAADLVFQNLTQGELGEVRLWRDRASISETLLRSVKRVWDVQAVGDLDGDGFGDLVWRYNVANSPDTGVSYIWFTDGTNVTQVRKRGGAPLDWTLLGAADLNGDGAADLIYIDPGNRVRALMATPARTCANLAAGTIPFGFRALKIADFTGNGRGDLLLRNTATGETRLMSLDARSLALPPGNANPDDPNASCTSSALVVNSTIATLASSDPSWQYFAALDLDGDGTADIVWLLPNGTLTVWLSNGGSVSPTMLANTGQLPIGFAAVQP